MSVQPRKRESTLLLQTVSSIQKKRSVHITKGENGEKNDLDKNYQWIKEVNRRNSMF